jgi:hypothetical protein
MRLPVSRKERDVMDEGFGGFLNATANMAIKEVRDQLRVA